MQKPPILFVLNHFNHCIILDFGLSQFYVNAWLPLHLIFQQFQMSQYNEKVLSQARKTRGYLEKCSSGLISIWQKRYFIIIEYNLCYFADQTLQERKKSISIKDINYIKVIEPKEFHLVTKKRIYELRAEDQQTRDLWVASLNILINQKQWTASDTKSSKSPEKRTTSRFASRTKKSEHNTSSPPSLLLNKSTSMNNSRLKAQNQMTPDVLFSRIGLSWLNQNWKKDEIRNKILLIKQFRSYYFIISCKTLLKSYEDQDFLKEQLIAPLQFNTLYFYDYDQNQVSKVCRCNEIERVEDYSKKIVLQTLNNRIEISLDFKKTELSEVLLLVEKFKHSAQVGKEYYNSANIKIKRNIDKILYKFDHKEMTVSQIVKKQIQKICLQGKQSNHKHDFRKNIESIKKSLRQIINCCDALGKSRLQFKEKIIKEFSEQSFLYIQKGWNNVHKNVSKSQQKKILSATYQLWKLTKDIVKQSKLYQFVMSLQCKLVLKYKEEIINKVDSCFTLSQAEISDEVSIQIKGENQIIQKIDTVFYSNKIYKQFHIDIRLVLHEFPEMLINEKVLEEYMFFFRSVFQYLSQQTFKCIDKWKDVNLLLGTCNQIQFIKSTLFEQMQSKFIKWYPSCSKNIRKKLIDQLDTQMSNTQILLMKKLFVSTFSTIDRVLLCKEFNHLSISHICQQIVKKLKSFTKINKYVKKNIFQASFEQICYFYYSNLIKFNKSNSQKQQSVDFYIKKISEDIKAIGEYFEKFINHQKIYAHLKDLNLLKQFIQTDVSQIKKVCQSLKKQFGNSFTQIALVNLLSLRDMSQQMRQNLAVEYFQIVKNSVDTPEEISLMSSNRQSFLQNWNNTRSRKSTLTLSLNEFYQNQHAIHQNKKSCAVWKQGYLFKKLIQKNLNSSEIHAFYKISQSKLLEYESQTNESLNTAYELQMVRNCYLHPDKNYIFFLDFKDFKLQFKAETSDQAKEWIRNIYQEISAINVLNDLPQKERTTSNNILEVQKECKDPSTMQSYTKVIKEKSFDKSSSGSPKILRKKGQIEKGKNQSVQRKIKSTKQIKQAKQLIDDNCLKCSKGLLF